MKNRYREYAPLFVYIIPSRNLQRNYVTFFTCLSSGAELPLRVDPLAHLGPALGQADEGQPGEFGLLREHAQLVKAPGLAPVL